MLGLHIHRTSHRSPCNGRGNQLYGPETKYIQWSYNAMSVLQLHRRKEKFYRVNKKRVFRRNNVKAFFKSHLGLDKVMRFASLLNRYSAQECIHGEIKDINTPFFHYFFLLRSLQASSSLFCFTKSFSDRNIIITSLHGL